MTRRVPKIDSIILSRFYENWGAWAFPYRYRLEEIVRALSRVITVEDSIKNPENGQLAPLNCASRTRRDLTGRANYNNRLPYIWEISCRDLQYLSQESWCEALA
jgi:hypothetical protein